MKNYSQLTRDQLMELVTELQQQVAASQTQLARLAAERQQAEKALAHHAAMVESSDDAIIGKSLDGYINSWNHGAENIFGYASGEVIGKHISLLIPKDRLDEEPGILEKIRRGESVDHYETIRRRKDGKMINISVTISPIRQGDGKITGASKVARDITERKRLESEILDISEREQRRIGNDLHDGLCQELTGIELMCQALEQKLSAKSKAQSRQVGDIASHIRNAIAHTRKLARGLSPVEIEANGFMSALHELAVNAHQRHAVECVLECPALVLIRNHIFATHLFRIVQEAISNATRHGRAKRIVIALRPAGDKVVLTVADDGKGFAHDPTQSTGMGLHIMRYRAGMVGAALEIQGGIGTGTTITCTFKRNI